MVNRCESLINVVTNEQAKGADRLEPKGKWPGSRSFVIFCRRRCATGEEAGPNPFMGTQVKRGKPVVLPLGKRAARQADRTAGKGCWRKRSECRLVMRSSFRIGIASILRQHHPSRKSGQTSSRCPITRPCGKPLGEGMPDDRPIAWWPSACPESTAKSKGN